MNNKVNYDAMKKAYDGLLSTFVAKNRDYGNSFEQSMDTHGLVASIVRMEDKFNRLKSLAGREKDALVASESLSDTLLDLANYAVMTACWLMNNDGDYTQASWKPSPLDKDYALSSDINDQKVNAKDIKFTVSERFFKKHIDPDLKLVERNAVVNKKDILDSIVTGKINTKDIKIEDVKDRVLNKTTATFNDSESKTSSPKLTLVPRNTDINMYGPYVIFGGKVNLLYYPGAAIKVDRHDGNPQLYHFILQRDSFNGVDTLFLFDYMYQAVGVLNAYAKDYQGDVFEFIRKHELENVGHFKKEKATKDIFKQIDLHHTLSSEFVRADDDNYFVGPSNIRCINQIIYEATEEKSYVIIYGTLGMGDRDTLARNFIFFEDTGEVVMSRENLMPTFDNGNNINGVIKAKCDFSGSYIDQIKRIYDHKDEERC